IQKHRQVTQHLRQEETLISQKYQTHSLTAPNGAITGQKINLNLHIFIKFVVLIDCIFSYDYCISS
ncbi:hypothetical protein OY11_24415, partial [Salmonella enterica]|nr:hypothetical protein [Salmonella enterica]